MENPLHNPMQEVEIYRDLAKSAGFAAFYNYCSLDSCFFIFLERLTKDMYHMFRTKRSKFTEEYVYTLGAQMFERIETLHKLGYVHRDLKPSQFMYKRHSAQLHLVDFNLARKYPISFAYVSQHNGGFVGNATFASVSAHKIGQQTRRDDCESVLYIIIYLLKSSLPWQSNGQDRGREPVSQVFTVKMKTPLSELCKGLPVELGIMLSRARATTFEEAPDYAFFKSTLLNLRKKCGRSLSTELNLASPVLSEAYRSSKQESTFSLANSSMLSGLSTLSVFDNSPGLSPTKDRSTSSGASPTKSLRFAKGLKESEFTRKHLQSCRQQRHAPPKTLESGEQGLSESFRPKEVSWRPSSVSSGIVECDLKPYDSLAAPILIPTPRLNLEANLSALIKRRHQSGAAPKPSGIQESPFVKPKEVSWQLSQIANSLSESSGKPVNHTFIRQQTTKIPKSGPSGINREALMKSKKFCKDDPSEQESSNLPGTEGQTEERRESCAVM
jgi:serine/threonine protein kinase